MGTVPPRDGESIVSIDPASAPHTFDVGFRIEEIWVYRGGQWSFDKRVEIPFMVDRD